MSTEADVPKRLQEIATVVREGGTPEPETVRTLLSWFGAQRRGIWVVYSIHNALKECGLETQPDFEYQYIDGPIEFKKLVPKPSVAAAPASSSILALQSTLTVQNTALATDPTYRIGRFPAANRPPVFVCPDASVSEAVTLMLSRDFSQLPVMQGERDVKGIVSWASIGSRLALGRTCATVRDCMDFHHEIRADSSLFDAIAVIVQYQYVLIRDAQQRISGIVTSSDLSMQFRQLAEPFLLLAEIENHLRQLIGDKFAPAVLQEARDPSDSSRQVSCIADLTFGEYIRLMEQPDRWSALRLQVDRKVFLEQLQQVRKIRNDVMHFDPDGIGDDELETLREFGIFLRKLRALGTA